MTMILKNEILHGYNFRIQDFFKCISWGSDTWKVFLLNDMPYFNLEDE